MSKRPPSLKRQASSEKGACVLLHPVQAEKERDVRPCAVSEADPSDRPDSAMGGARPSPLQRTPSGVRCDAVLVQSADRSDAQVKPSERAALKTAELEIALDKVKKGYQSASYAFTPIFGR